jgi:hypothetical protein
MKTRALVAVTSLALASVLGTQAASASTVDPIQHALVVVGSKLCQGGACKVTYPATWMPAARADIQEELFAGHGTTFTVENYPSASQAHQSFEYMVSDMASYGQRPTRYQFAFSAVARMGTFLLMVKQPTEMCYWLDRAVEVAHLPLAYDANGNC